MALAIIRAPASLPHGQVDIFVARHAQRAGWLLLLGSIYLLIAMLRSLLA